MRNRFILMALCAVGLALPATAFASPQYEPNDGIHQAYGPMEAGVNYDATISSNSDRDWYIIYVSGAGLLDVSLTNTGTGWPGFSLRNVDGHLLVSESEVEPGTTDHLDYTTPGPGTYYVSVGGGDDYRLRITGPLTDGPRPGPAEPTPNNNPTMATAFGPLLGGKLYGGSIDAQEEEDWFFFYTAGAGRFDVALASTVDARGDSGWPGVYLLDGDGNRLSSESEVEPDTVDHLEFTSPGPGKFVLKVVGPGSNYQFRIDPASLITPVPPPAVAPPPVSKSASAPCKRARQARKKVFANFKKAQRKRNVAKRKGRKARRSKARRNWRKSKRRWAKTTKKRRKALTKANRRMKRLCT